MKTDTHPQYFTDAKVTCANCNNEFTTGATQQEIRVEICSSCHPFFTGKKVLIDTEGRVDSFRKKMENAAGRKKKVRKKLTLEDKVNTALAAQLEKDKAAEEKEKAKKAAKKADKEAAKAKVEQEVAEAPAAEVTNTATEEPAAEEAAE